VVRRSIPYRREWDDAEIETFTRRVARLMKEGLTEVQAERLAERMLLRDRPVSGDDRRICLECRGLRKGWCESAPRRFEPVRTVLQRCDWFALKGASKPGEGGR